MTDLLAHARDLLARNRYLTLGTADPDGRPWLSPVYFAAADEREFVWCSESDARHSRNLVERPRVSVVVYDSTVPAYHGRAVYATATAREVPDDGLDRALDIYPGPPERGGVSLTRADVTGAEPYRMYVASVSRLWVLCPREPRTPCALHGLSKDHRALVEP
ncbi:hypothetical protein Val02_12690 [Virgisporangium aliadipatigenens]|uniref:Pyridoxamine 5'-phosphate oxidase N-terminal domain-containing protein n=1 Tax=Virgisporangium aliadipatigenens TaxID=741659 RepID=A0A8J4DP89_9ACTN|nr:pyridoxamine 5'-phosphate oxidase family protein [Virgisporangium aliadipatigenens]GIJ44383.1 hypothetical protein Val02_12690 [Virgisporangium aliadipatigenens]